MSPALPAIRIPVYRPELGGNEMAYVQQCLESTWISSKGEFIERFQNDFARFIGAGHVVAVTNGTVALHLALLGVGIGPGDEVIVPSLTYVAAVNAIRYVGATPVFADADAQTWQIDPAHVARLITPRTRAILAVHTYGQACDLAALASETRHLVDPLAERRRISIDARLSPATCLGDAVQLEQVLTNLLSNAVDHNADDGRIRVTTAVEEGVAILTVWNSGPPIPPPDLPRIFDRFHRVDRSRTSIHGHTGLGLAIVQAIIQAHGGRVQARSSLAEGTCFTVHLPAAPSLEAFRAADSPA